MAAHYHSGDIAFFEDLGGAMYISSIAVLTTITRDQIHAPCSSPKTHRLHRF